MDHYDIAYAREHLDELIARADGGEAITIVDPKRGTFLLSHVPRPRKPPRLGLLEGKMKVPERLFEPMSDEELAEWYGVKS